MTNKLIAKISYKIIQQQTNHPPIFIATAINILINNITVQQLQLSQISQQM